MTKPAQTSQDQDLRTALKGVDVRAEADAYEFRADEGDYTPTEHERAMLEDFGNGLMVRIEEEIAGSRAAPPRPVDAERVEDAAAELLKASIEDYGLDDDDADDEHVAVGVNNLDEQWKSAVTFGHLRRLQTALSSPAHSTDKAVTREGVSGYEVCEPIQEDDGLTTLTASYTPNNGIRLHVEHEDEEDDAFTGAVEFDLNQEQARQLGERLIRWSAHNHGFAAHTAPPRPDHAGVVEHCGYTECAALGRTTCEDCRDLTPAQAPDKAAEREGVEYRVGRKVRRNVYRGDQPVFMAANESEAVWLVALLNAGQTALIPKPTVTEASRGVIPAGWKLVPEEPTPEMRVAANEAFMAILGCSEADIYRAMLAATPTPPVSPTPDSTGPAGVQGTLSDEPYDPLKCAIWAALLPFQDELLQTGGVTFMGLRNSIVEAVRSFAIASQKEYPAREALEDLKVAADDLARLSVEEGDAKAAGALQFISGFISDRLAALTPFAPIADPVRDDGARELPRLTDRMIRAACKGHYGDDNIDGIDLTVAGVNWSFRQGFQRMWTGIRKELRASLPAPAGDVPGEAQTERVRHVKRGTEYEVLGEAEAQVAVAVGHKIWQKGGDPILDEPVPARLAFDGCKLTVYRDPKTGKLWCRFTDEFRDGRFVTLAPGEAQTQEGGR